MILRLSGPLAARPSSLLARRCFYYATDTETVYESFGETWGVRTRKLDEEEIVGRTGGTMAARPTASSMIGWLYSDSDTGSVYEAFPGGWAKLPGEAQVISLTAAEYEALTPEEQTDVTKIYAIIG